MSFWTELQDHLQRYAAVQGVVMLRTVYTRRKNSSSWVKVFTKSSVVAVDVNMWSQG